MRVLIWSDMIDNFISLSFSLSGKDIFFSVLREHYEEQRMHGTCVIGDLSVYFIILMLPQRIMGNVVWSVSSYNQAQTLLLCFFIGFYNTISVQDETIHDTGFMRRDNIF